MLQDLYHDLSHFLVGCSWLNLLTQWVKWRNKKLIDRNKSRNSPCAWRKCITFLIPYYLSSMTLLFVKIGFETCCACFIRYITMSLFISIYLSSIGRFYFLLLSEVPKKLVDFFMGKCNFDCELPVKYLAVWVKTCFLIWQVKLFFSPTDYGLHICSSSLSQRGLSMAN